MSSRGCSNGSRPTSEGSGATQEGQHPLAPALGYHPLRHASRDPSRCTAPRPPGDLFGRARRRRSGPGGPGSAAGPVAADSRHRRRRGRRRAGDRFDRPSGSQSRARQVHGDDQRPASPRRLGRADRQRRSSTPAKARPRGQPASTAPERVIMLAVDCISFDTTASREVIQNVPQFVRGLRAGRLRRPVGVSERRVDRADHRSCRGAAGAQHRRRPARRSGPQPLQPPADRDHRRQPRFTRAAARRSTRWCSANAARRRPELPLPAGRRDHQQRRSITRGRRRRASACCARS